MNSDDSRKGTEPRFTFSGIVTPGTFMCFGCHKFRTMAGRKVRKVRGLLKPTHVCAECAKEAG